MISIKTTLTSKKTNEYVKLIIRDNGQGIKHENLKKIFDPFFSTKKPSKEHGTGLGLSISYGIIKSHGGEITIQSEWKKWTVIEILLPLKIQYE
ncbi:MAG: sensor histidine kinase [Candidatus Helarchaeota archaeon]